MAISTGDVLRVKTYTDFLGVTALNIYHILVITADATNGLEPEQWAQGWAESFEDVIKVMRTSNAIVNRVVVENLSDPLFSFGEYPCEIAGSQAADAYASFGALAYRQNVGTRVTRNGYKRFVGVPENNVSNGVYSPTFLDLCSDLELFFGGGIQSLVTPFPLPIGTFYHVVLKSTAVPPNLTINVDYQRVTSANFIDRPTTQNSRKVRGT